MAKSKDRVQAKMLRNVASAGAEVRAGMEAADDPIDIALKDVDGHAKKMTDGLKESVRTGKFKSGLEKAKKRGSWKKSIARAAQHFEERAPEMVENAMEDYDERMAATDRALAEVSNMPRTTRAQRIAYGAAYQAAAGKQMDKLYNRKE